VLVREKPPDSKAFTDRNGLPAVRAIGARIHSGVGRPIAPYARLMVIQQTPISPDGLIVN